MSSTEIRLGWIGESVRRVDGTPKTTGEFEYASDLQVAGMLWGHTLRSAYAHARVRSIDLSGALSVAGVHAVLTHADVPGAKLYGLEFQDQPVLAYQSLSLHYRLKRLLTARGVERPRPVGVRRRGGGKPT